MGFAQESSRDCTRKSFWDSSQDSFRSSFSNYAQSCFKDSSRRLPSTVSPKISSGILSGILVVIQELFRRFLQNYLTRCPQKFLLGLFKEFLPDFQISSWALSGIPPVILFMFSLEAPSGLILRIRRTCFWDTSRSTFWIFLDETMKWKPLRSLLRSCLRCFIQNSSYLREFRMVFFHEFPKKLLQDFLEQFL